MQMDLDALLGQRSNLSGSDNLKHRLMQVKGGELTAIMCFRFLFFLKQ